MADDTRKLCRLDEIPDGEGKSLEIEQDGEVVDVFVVRQGDTPGSPQVVGEWGEKRWFLYYEPTPTPTPTRKPTRTPTPSA